MEYVNSLTRRDDAGSVGMVCKLDGAESEDTHDSQIVERNEMVASKNGAQVACKSWRKSFMSFIPNGPYMINMNLSHSFEQLIQMRGVSVLACGSM